MCQPELFRVKGGYREGLELFGLLEKRWKELYGSSTPIGVGGRPHPIRGFAQPFLPGGKL